MGRGLTGTLQPSISGCALWDATNQPPTGSIFLQRPKAKCRQNSFNSTRSKLLTYEYNPCQIQCLVLKQCSCVKTSVCTGKRYLLTCAKLHPLGWSDGQGVQTTFLDGSNRGCIYYKILQQNTAAMECGNSCTRNLAIKNCLQLLYRAGICRTVLLERCHRLHLVL